MNRDRGAAERICPVLVGRDDALALLRRRWSAALEGSGHLLLVAGEAGIGKTRLLREFTDSLVDARAIATGCYPGDGDVPGAMLLALSEALGRARHDLADDVRTVLSNALLGATGADDGALRRRMLLLEVARLLEDALLREPTVIVVEDLHWADELSLDALERLARVVADAPAMVIVSYRSDELYPRLPLQSWRSRMLERRIGEELRLPRLGPAETARMMEAIEGDVAATELAASLYERSDGIPLHVEELLDSTEATVPDTLREVVAARAARLSGTARAVVETASVIGRSFEPGLLESVSGLSAEALSANLNELEEQLLLVRRRHGTGFDFRHALLRDAVYAGIAPDRLRMLHDAVGRVALDAGMPAAYVSDHLERAGNAAAAHRLALTAARDARRVSAHREAAALYYRAQRTMPGDVTPQDRAGLRAELAISLAAIDDNEGAATQLAAAIDSYRRYGAEEAAAALVPPLMAAQHLLGIASAERIALAADAVQRLDDAGIGASAPRAALLGAIAAARMLDRRLDDATSFAVRSGELADAAGSLLLRADADITHGAVLVFAGGGERGWSLISRATEQSEAAGFEAQTARGFRMLGSAASVLVEYERAQDWIARGLDYTAKTEQWNDHHYLAAHRAHVQWAMGDWTNADRSARQAIADGGGITTRITALLVLGYLELGRDQPQLARVHLDEARAIGERMNELQRLSPALWGLAEVALHAGDLHASVELCELGYAASARVRDAAYLFPFVVTGTRALLAASGGTAARDWLARCAVLVRERGIPGTLASIDHAEGLIHLAEGRTGQARAALERAGDGWHARHRYWEGSHALIDLAICAHRSRRPAEADRLKRDVHDRATTSGALLLERRTTAIGPESAEADAGGLSARELEVARLVAAGATNRQIGERLVISTKTASSHVEHILAKLGFARRTEIAAWFSERMRG